MHMMKFLQLVCEMLTARAQRILIVSRVPPVLAESIRSKFRRWQDEERQKAEDEKELQMRRRVLDPKSGIYVQAEDWMQVGPKKDYEDRTQRDMAHPGFDMVTVFQKFRYWDISFQHQRRKQRYHLLSALQHDQRYLPERQLILGPDLSAAHFIVHRGGAVKFFGNDTWIRADEKTGEYSLPNKRVDNLELEAIDASFMLLLWEGFDNLTRLERLRFLSVANGFYINDWCLNRIQQFSKSLEFLDVSNCKRISARGLAALISCKNLKFLRLDGLDHIKDLAKVALALEEANPDLQILGLDYKKALGELDRELKLVENPNVFEDARGNLHMKDRLGEFYFLKGALTNFEKPILDEFGLPLYMSRIRRDSPDLPPEEVEKINRLVDGKLKHLLVGSPSGEWTMETERLLTFEAFHKWKIGEKIDPIFLPECMKDRSPKESFVQKIRKFLPFGSERAASLPALAVDPKESKNLLVKPDDAPISHEIRSPPPKPRPPRLFGKFQRYSANYDKYPW